MLLTRLRGFAGFLGFNVNRRSDGERFLRPLANLADAKENFPRRLLNIRCFKERFGSDFGPAYGRGLKR